MILSQIVETEQPSQDSRLIHAATTGGIIAAAVEVHRELGPGPVGIGIPILFVSRTCVARRSVSNPSGTPVDYKGIHLDCGYRIDLLVENKVAVELKSVEKLLPIHQAQPLTYLRLSKMRIGLLINFNVRVLRDGVIRRVL